MRLCDIGNLEVQQWVNGMPESTKMRSRIVTHFNLIWKKARLWGYTKEASPAEGISLGPRRTSFQREIPTDDQYRHIVAILPDPLGEMAELVVSTGLRISEVRGLYVRTVDIAHRAVRVETRKDSLDHFDDPKTEAGRRILPLGAMAVKMALRIRGRAPNELVYDAGCYEYCQERLRDAAKLAGFVSRGFGWHSLRRCHNTWYRKTGGSRDDAKAQMGHATDQVNDLYLIPESEDFQRREEQVLKMQTLLMGEAKGGIA